MSQPHSPTGFFNATKLFLLTAVNALLLSACVSAPNPQEPSPSSEGDMRDGSETPEEDRKAIATSFHNASAEGNNLRFDIFSLERHSKEIVILTMAVTNDSTENAFVMHSLTELGGQPSSPDGVSLIDTSNQKRYMPLKLTDGKTCHCSSWAGSESLAPGDTIEVWAAFPSPPQETDRVVVTTPVTPDFLDIPITEAAIRNNAVSDAPVGEPRILDIRAFEDDINSESSRSDSSDESQVILSSDILFDLNESKLTPKSDSTLKAVAEEIDASSATTIRIDGHTDDSGDDSINNPLSKERAMAVKQKLEELTTREGITFEAIGHGSKDPVGDNTTEEGQKKNRRVTITFPK